MGGQGLTLVEEIIFNEELGKVNAPRGMNLIGNTLLGPVLISSGTEEQKKRFIPKLLAAEEVWCQGFSEPNAGSDLASISTKAELDGEEWVINGQKVWTSNAQAADWCFVLARTDVHAPKHRGITFFLVPMDLPGITVRPLKQITGDQEFNEVFFENVRVPKDSYVGNLNEGWQTAMTTLSFERGTSPLGDQARVLNEIQDLIRLSRETVKAGQQLSKNPYYRQKLAKSYVEIAIMRYHGLKVVSKFMNEGKIGPEASLMKLYWSESHQDFTELAMEIEGNYANMLGSEAPFQGKFQQIYLYARAETIFSGTSQIQKNIISERLLGMPK